MSSALFDYGSKDIRMDHAYYGQHSEDSADKVTREIRYNQESKKDLHFGHDEHDSPYEHLIVSANMVWGNPAIILSESNAIPAVQGHSQEIAKKEWLEALREIKPSIFENPVAIHL